ncbi:winged helix-turn-helix transcriptional regulator [Streptomyces sp. NPDC020983]|uniref:winged helix-turn-helix transcriptional regulator n=1 Tax=Streptomyces sp. NPDC020983 TaxID=3365106 RepID=UPI0037AC5DDC
MTTTPASAPAAGALPFDALSADCPSRSVVDRLTSRWGVLVLAALRRGRVMRFSELRRTVEGVSEKMLAQTLQGLEREGLVHREARPVVPPHVEYTLTSSGEEAAALVIGIVTWAEANAEAILRCRASYDARRTARTPSAGQEPPLPA